MQVKQEVQLPEKLSMHGKRRWLIAVCTFSIVPCLNQENTFWICLNFESNVGVLPVSLFGCFLNPLNRIYKACSFIIQE